MTFGPTKTDQRRVVVLPRLLVEPLAEYIGARRSPQRPGVRGAWRGSAA